MKNQEVQKKTTETGGTSRQLRIQEKKRNDELHAHYHNQFKKERKELHKDIAQLQKNLKAKDHKIEALTNILVEEKNRKDLLEESRIMFKEQMENLNEKVIQLAEKTNAMVALKLEIDKLSGNLYELQDECQKLNAINDNSLHMSILEKQIKTMQSLLTEKEYEINHLRDLNQALITKERISNDELQEARKEMINGWVNTPNGGSIGVKRIGELNKEPFLRAFKGRTFGDYRGSADSKAEFECIVWDAYLRDPRWHPFKVITVNEELQEIVDSEDGRLKALQNEYGNEAYMTVVSALKEMKGNNPSGKFFALELWNYAEERKATLKEGVSSLLNIDYKE